MENEAPSHSKSFPKLPVGIMAIAALVVVGLGLFLINKTGLLKTKEPGNGTIVTMVMQADTFQPVDITIKQGTKIVFRNEDTQGHWPASDIHPTHSIYPEFDPKQPVNPGDSWSFIFDRVGKWRYHDHLVPSTRGTITVTP